jgi:MFS family permease
MTDTSQGPDSAPAAAPAPSKAGWSAWWMLAVLLACYVLSALDKLVIYMLVDPIQKEMGLTDFQISLLIGPAFAICFGLAGYPLGWASDRLSRRWVIAGGVTFWSMATIATSLSKTFGGLFVARVGEAALAPSAYSLIADRFPRKRLTTALSIYGMGPKLGTAASFAIGGAVIGYASHLGHVDLPIVGTLSPWRLALLMIGLPGVFFAMLMFTFREPVRRGRKATAAAAKGLGSYLKANWKLYGSLLIGFSFAGMAAGGLIAWAPTYMTRHFGWTAQHYGPIMGAVSLIAALSIMAKGVVIDWLYARGIQDAHVRFYTWLLAAAVPLTILAFVVQNPYAFILLYGAVNVVAVSFMLYVSATLQILAPSHFRGRITAIFMFMITVVAGGAAPTIIASLTDFVFQDKQALGLSLGLVSVTGLTLALLMLRYALIPLKAPLAEALAEAE